MRNNNRILVLDSPCGSGKSTALHRWMAKNLRKYPDLKFIYITPTISEVDRLFNFFVEEELVRDKDPDNNRVEVPGERGGTKFEEAINAIEKGKSIIITQALFLQHPIKFCELIEKHKIHVVFDETLNMFQEHEIPTGDLIQYIENGKIIFNEETKIITKDKYARIHKKTSLNKIFVRMEESTVYLMNYDPQKKTNNPVCIEIFPIEEFKRIKWMTICTYLFEGDLMRTYLDMCGLTYEYYHVTGNYQEYHLEKGVSPSQGSSFKNNIVVYETNEEERRGQKSNYNEYWFKDNKKNKYEPSYNLTVKGHKENILNNDEYSKYIETQQLFTFKSKKYDKIGTYEEYRQEKSKIMNHIKYLYNLPIEKGIAPNNNIDPQADEKHPYRDYVFYDFFEKMKTPKKSRDKIRHKIESSAYMAQQIRNYVVNHKKAKKEEILWTTFKNNNKVFESERMIAYTRNRGKKLTFIDEDEEKIESDVNFCYSTIKAVNDFSDRFVLVYAIDKRFRPNYRNVITSINPNVSFDGKAEDVYALSSMIQWIFRSRIRKGETIYIYIPSKRMRKILYKWFNDGYNAQTLVDERNEKLKKLKEKEAEDKKSPNKGKREHNQN